MNNSRLGVGDLIAVASGAVLLIVMFLPWYGVEVSVADVSLSDDANAWQTLSFIDIVLFLCALVAIGVPVARSAGVLPAELPGPLLVLVVGALALLLVLYRLVDIPAPDVPTVAEDSVDFTRKVGVVLALLAAAGIAYGGWRSNAERPAA